MSRTLLQDNPKGTSRSGEILVHSGAGVTIVPNLNLAGNVWRVLKEIAACKLRNIQGLGGISKYKISAYGPRVQQATEGEASCMQQQHQQQQQLNDLETAGQQLM